MALSRLRTLVAQTAYNKFFILERSYSFVPKGKNWMNGLISSNCALVGHLIWEEEGERMYHQVAGEDV